MIMEFCKGVSNALSVYSFLIELQGCADEVHYGALGVMSLSSLRVH